MKQQPVAHRQFDERGVCALTANSVLRGNRVQNTEQLAFTRPLSLSLLFQFFDLWTLLPFYSTPLRDRVRHPLLLMRLLVKPKFNSSVILSHGFFLSFLFFTLYLTLSRSPFLLPFVLRFLTFAFSFSFLPIESLEERIANFFLLPPNQARAEE